MKKITVLALCIMLLVGCNDNLPSDNKSITSTPDKVQNTAEVSKSEEEVLLENFMEDASVPQDVRNDLIEAMHGNTTTKAVVRVRMSLSNMKSLAV